MRCVYSRNSDALLLIFGPRLCLRTLRTDSDLIQIFLFPPATCTQLVSSAVE